MKEGMLPMSKREIRKQMKKKMVTAKYRVACLRQECSECGFFLKQPDGDGKKKIDEEDSAAGEEFRPEIFKCPLEVDGDDEVWWTETKVHLSMHIIYPSHT